MILSIRSIDRVQLLEQPLHSKTDRRLSGPYSDIQIFMAGMEILSGD